MNWVCDNISDKKLPPCSATMHLWFSWKCLLVYYSQTDNKLETQAHKVFGKCILHIKVYPQGYYFI